MAFVLQRLNSFFRSFILAVWNSRSVILFCISAASFITNLAILSVSFRLRTLVVCQFFCHVVMPQFWKIFSRFLDPRYLYILLNFVLMTIVVKSSVLSPAKHADLPQGAEKKYPITFTKATTKASLAAECDVEKSDTSLPSSPKKHDQATSLPSASAKKHEQAVEKKRPILFIEPLHKDGSDAHLYSSPKKNDFAQCDIEYLQDTLSESSARTSSEVQVPPSNSVEAAEGTIIFDTAYEQKAAPSSHRIVMDPVYKVGAQVVQLEESSNVGGRPDDQLLQIDDVQIEDDMSTCTNDDVECEDAMSTEDLNRKAEDFISNFRKQLKMQRQDSYNRYLHLLTGREGRSR